MIIGPADKCCIEIIFLRCSYIKSICKSVYIINNRYQIASKVGGVYFGTAPVDDYNTKKP